MPHARWNLRREVLAERRADGSMVLLDPLFERIEPLSPTQVGALDAGDPAALAALDERWLRQGPTADAVRAAAWAARLRPEPAPPAAVARMTHDTCVDVSRVGWAPAWQDPERWRRLGEAGIAGTAALCLEGLFAADLAAAARDQVQALPREHVEAAVIAAERVRGLAATGGALGTLQAALAAPATRRFFGAALGRPLGEELHLNAWRLGPGQRMAVHQDGARYAATVAIGLNPGWSAGDGGAIAFGVPGPAGLGVQWRWLPHAGDVLVFAPTATSWHAVEPPTRERWTVSGWWLR